MENGRSGGERMKEVILLIAECEKGMRGVALRKVKGVRTCDYLDRPVMGRAGSEGPPSNVKPPKNMSIFIPDVYDLRTGVRWSNYALNHPPQSPSFSVSAYDHSR